MVAHHGRILQERSLCRSQRVQTRRDQCLDRVRQRDGAGVVHDPAVAEHPDELERVQRIAAGALHERCLCVGGQDRAHEQLGQQLLHRVFRQRRERDGRSVRLAAAPPGANVEELGPGGPHQQDRRDIGLVVQLIQEIEHGLVRPVEILDGEDER